VHLYFNLQEAKETLCDPAQRKNYDKWRNSGISISYKSWKDMKDHVHQVSLGYLIRREKNPP
jgi:DnaJ family protein C protein 12